MNRMLRRSVPVAVGFTVKSGWAAAVLLGGPVTSPRVIDCCRVELCDPDLPDARQPYHEGFGTARREGPALRRLLAAVRGSGAKAIASLLRRYASEGYRPARAGIAVGSLIDPATIANEHIRIHALEGRLFRTVIEDAVARAGVVPLTATGRDLFERAPALLKRPPLRLRLALSELERPQARPWRAEQKLAALAGWVSLAEYGRRPAAGRRRR